MNVLSSDAAVIPAACGLLRPALLLPTSANEWPEAHRQSVLCHELAHVKRLDCITQLVAQLACALFWFHPGALDAQEPATIRESRMRSATTVRVFLDCDYYCDSDYLRVETPWVAFVRDRTASDVHVLVTRIETGSGGHEYTIGFTGRGAFGAIGDTLHLFTTPEAADAVVREGLTNTIQLGLVQYAAHTRMRRDLRVSTLHPEAVTGTTTATNAARADPWKSWVFEIGLDGSLEREERQSQLESEATLSATRITPAWKFGITAEGRFDRERYELDDGVTISRRERYYGGAVLIRSLGSHWGVGVEAVASSSTFDNTSLALRAAPAIEYSFWPYREATTRQLTLQYSVGVSSFDYREETVFGRLAETRPTQSLLLGYDTRQRWGSADAGLEFANFPDDFGQYRVAFDGDLEFRLVRGLSLELEGSVSLIRDQLSLAKRDATEEEVLLELRALSTDYRHRISLGLTYTFGSIFSSVVNPRFGSGPGDILR